MLAVTYWSQAWWTQCLQDSTQDKTAGHSHQPAAVGKYLLIRPCQEIWGSYLERAFCFRWLTYVLSALWVTITKGREMSL